MAGRHRQERQMLHDALEKRWIAETNARAARLPSGFSGVWKRITGGYAKIRAQNEREAWNALLRDRAERDEMVASQLDERRDLQQHIREQRERQQTDLLLLREDIARYQEMNLPERSGQQREKDRKGRKRGRENGRDFGFER
jgi:small-conductance mechanosensitive channel